MYGKLSIVLFAAWGGTDGGITAGLISCSVVLVATSTAAHLMQAGGKWHQLTGASFNSFPRRTSELAT